MGSLGHLANVERINDDHSGLGPVGGLATLMGRFPGKATTENGPIRVGDLLVSSSTPGAVMLCGKSNDCAGTLVGKALEALEHGDGMIEMLLMR